MNTGLLNWAGSLQGRPPTQLRASHSSLALLHTNLLNSANYSSPSSQSWTTTFSHLPVHSVHVLQLPHFEVQ